MLTEEKPSVGTPKLVTKVKRGVIKQQARIRIMAVLVAIIREDNKTPFFLDKSLMDC
jgi:hypothetical protein